MQISSINGQNVDFTKSSSIKGEEKGVQTDKGKMLLQEDTIDISEAGKRKAKALQSEKSSGPELSTEDNSSGQDGDGSNVSNGGDNVVSLEQKLQTKKSETKRKKQKLDALRSKAQDDPAHAAELQKLKGELDRLQREEKKIKSEVYGS